MMIQTVTRFALVAGATALVLAGLMANVATACDSCLLHGAAVLPVPPEGNTVLTQSGFPLLAISALVGIGLALVVAYGIKRALAKQESAQ